MIEIHTWLLILIMLIFYLMGFTTAIWLIAIREFKKIVKILNDFTSKK